MSLRRSVYLPLLRDLTPTALATFDFAEQGMVTGSRDTTTVAPQALYLLNDPFVLRQALTLADRLLARNELDESARVDWAYRQTFGRGATPDEVERARAYVAEYENAAQGRLPPTRCPRHRACRPLPPNRRLRIPMKPIKPMSRWSRKRYKRLVLRRRPGRVFARPSSARPNSATSSNESWCCGSHSCGTKTFEG